MGSDRPGSELAFKKARRECELSKRPQTIKQLTGDVASKHGDGPSKRTNVSVGTGAMKQTSLRGRKLLGSSVVIRVSSATFESTAASLLELW